LGEGNQVCWNKGSGPLKTLANNKKKM
jgi:hypothetical protein